jgi:hypothetical protein
MKLIDKILGPMQDVRSTLEKQRRLITEKKAKLRAIEQMPCSPAEAIAKAHSDIEFHAQRYRDGLRPRADPKDFELFSTWLFDRSTPPSDLLLALCCLANPIMKAGAEREVTAAWPTKSITVDEREKQITTLRREIEEAETLEEQMNVELETVGAKIDRRADLNPGIYLEFKDAIIGTGKSWMICGRLFAASEAASSRSTMRSARLRAKN